MRILIALAGLCLFFSPAPYGIALNHQTKACGNYWGGDEYIDYKLLPGWKAYYPIDGVIQTEIGNFPWHGDTENFCRLLGYTYIPGNIGIKYGIGVWTSVTYLVLAITCWPLYPTLLIAFVLIFLSRGRSDPLPSLTAGVPVDRTALLRQRATRIELGLCPKCGNQVMTADKNCPSCRINLEFAREHIDEW
jgi:hypothetical protein